MKSILYRYVVTPSKVSIYTANVIERGEELVLVESKRKEFCNREVVFRDELCAFQKFGDEISVIMDTNNGDKAASILFGGLSENCSDKIGDYNKSLEYLRVLKFEAYNEK